MLLHRLFLFLLNIFFPPLSVLLLTGPYTDTLINCILFLCGVIPSHIHGFYINCTYFHRKRKVRKGKWPGGPKSFIYDRTVWYGGATRAEAEALRTSGRGARGKGKAVDGRGEMVEKDEVRDRRRQSEVMRSGVAVVPGGGVGQRNSIYGNGMSVSAGDQRDLSRTDRRSVYRGSYSQPPWQQQPQQLRANRRSIRDEVFT